MIDRAALLSDLQKLLTKLEADLLERSESADVPDVGATLRAEFDRAKKAERTAQNYEDWRSDAITQASAAWVLACVFVRFLEDNRLIDPPKIAGPTAAEPIASEPRPSGSGSSPTGNKSPLPDGRGSTVNRLQRARDEHELYFREHPTLTDRDYLLSLFDDLAQLPGTRDLFGEHNPIRELPNWLSGDAAGELLKFFQKIDANSGLLVHDFCSRHAPRDEPNGQMTSSERSAHHAERDGYVEETRFLGDLYQDLSEAARKKFALLQTPEFVEEFILERTLEPALDEFGLEPVEPRPSGSGSSSDDQKTPLPDGRGSKSAFKMIDPACGSGHFLLGSFRRILDRWQRWEPGTNVRELVQRTLDSVHGVDVNPFAIAIARFRLLLAAMRACGIQRLKDAPAFRLNLVCGDSLLHAPLAAGGKKYTAGQEVFDFELTSDSIKRSAVSIQRSAGEEEADSRMLNADSFDECDHAYRSENLPELKRLLRGGQYHAVVANPPYITPKDRQLNERYRRRYRSCHMKYSLSVPFLERIFQLAVKGSEPRQSEQEPRPSGSGEAQPLPDGRGSGAGYTGQITANSFMKREFGKKLIESFFPSVDLTHVIDTSGAYIPGHGTPTVILFGRHRPPVASTLRTVMGIRGEPATPDDPAKGLVWSAIVETVDHPQSSGRNESGAATVRERNVATGEDTASLRARLQKHAEFVSVADSSRALFHKHPWSIGGGGASELKELLEEGAAQRLEALAQSIGFASFTGTDEAFLLEPTAFERLRVPSLMIRPTILGDNVRDWCINCELEALAPYDSNFDSYPYAADAPWGRYLWLFRNTLGSVISFGGKTRLECGDQWWTWYRWVKDKYRTPLSIVFGEVATHNHFVLDRGGKVFNRTAPVIKLPREASEDDHLALLGLLNSSTACFWMKQVCFPKGGDHVGQEGARVRRTAWDERFAFNGTNLEKFPLPLPDGRGSGPMKLEPRPSGSGVLGLAKQLDELAQQRQRSSPTNVLRASVPSRDSLSAAHAASDETLRQMIAAQEELDWECYRLYGLIEEDLTQRREGAKEDKNSSDLCASAPWREPPPLSLGQRAFEIVLARKMAAGETQTTWFERHGSTPITELPAEWPDDYRQLVERRIALIESDPNIRLIEQPEYKRRWNTEPWDSQLARALREWLLDRLESYFDFDGRMQDLTQRREGAEEDKNSSDLCASAPLREIALNSVAKLADVARQDAEFQQVGELYRDDPAFDVQKLVEELVAAESVPLLPVLRYKPTGLRKRAEWEKTWELQREEDRTAERFRTQCRLDHKPVQDDEPLNPNDVDWRTLADWLVYVADKTSIDEPDVYDRKIEVTIAELQAATDEAPSMTFSVLCRELNRRTIGDIPVPPKYDSKDFLDATCWRLRGKLDVPKERWISFPHSAGPDGTLVIAWAGYDHLQQAKAISAYYVDIQERLGGRDDPRLIPLLAGMLELLPWLKQWHNDPDATFDGMRMGDYFDTFATEEARQLGKTIPEIKAWEPPAKAKKKSTAKK